MSTDKESVEDGNGDHHEEAFEAAEERLDQLHDALLEAYAAGFARGAEFVEAEPDFDTDVEALKQKEPVRESHYYYWEGQKSKIELWLEEKRDAASGLMTDGGEAQATGEQHLRIARWLAGVTFAVTVGMLSATPDPIEIAIAAGMLTVFTALNFGNTEELPA